MHYVFCMCEHLYLFLKLLMDYFFPSDLSQGYALLACCADVLLILFAYAIGSAVPSTVLLVPLLLGSASLVNLLCACVHVVCVCMIIILPYLLRHWLRLKGDEWPSAMHGSVGQL